MVSNADPRVPAPDGQSDNISTGTAKATDNEEPKARTSTTLSKQLIQECFDLLSEVDAYQSLLASTLRNPQLVEARQFRTNVNTEAKILQKMAKQIEDVIAQSGPLADPDMEMRLVHALRSSNLPFYQAVWRIAKGSCFGLLALGKRFYWEGETKATIRERAKGGQPEKQPNKDKRKSAFVDIVADDGEEWVKVSTISENRLLFEMAEKGWGCDSESEEWSDDGKARTVLHNSDGEDDDDELELIKLAQDLRKAADATRVRYKHPRIRIVIPKIEEGSVPEIDAILNRMRSYGVQVECQESLPAETGDGLAHLLPQPFRKFTSTLNVDCTLLLAVVSDLSHVKDIQPSPSTHRAIIRQIEVEKEKPLLTSELWPAMDNRELVSTTEAAMRFREIVQTIGTEAEKTRTKLLLGEAPYEKLDRKAILQKFQELSDYEIPAEWQLPIKVVESQQAIDVAKRNGDLHPVVHEVGKDLSDINNSVFLYGWVTGLTTISSNRTIDKQIEATVENNRNGDDDLRGPDVWICDTARSLVGKDKDRKA